MGNTCTSDEKSVVTKNLTTTTHEEPYLCIATVDDTGKKKETLAVPRLKNIFNAPLDHRLSFTPKFFEKSETDRKFIHTALLENFIFATVPEKNLPTLIDAFAPCNFENEATIITEGEVGDYFYMIKEGTVDFFIKGEKVGKSEAGKGFGGLALIYDAPRAATCIAQGACSLWRLDQDTFRHIQANHAAQEGLDTKEILRKVPFLKDLDNDYLTRLAYAVTAESFAAGETIVKKGDPGDKFYVVKQGKVIIQDIEVGGKKFADQEGDMYFGERALVKNEPRAANIVAKEDTQVLSISGELFLDLLGNLSDLIIRTNDVRRLKGMKAFTNSKVSDSEYKNLTTLITDVTFLAGGEPIFKQGETREGVLYIVRSGQVTVTSDTADTKVLTDGGIFGEAYIHTEKSEITGTAVVDKDCVLGKLTEQNIYKVLRSRKRLHNPHGKKHSILVKKEIKFSDLKKHRILGVGTFGKVWLMSNTKSVKPEAFALKIQRKRQLLDHKQVDGALREMTIMSQLDHPFIVKMHAAYQDDSSIMILLSLVQGGELFNLMKSKKRGALGQNAACFYAAGILEGLSYMHHRQIIYRDLKPENVLIDSDGFPVIVDLGFAKIVPEKTYTLCGTPWYIAPEVILGRGHDKSCDHWSLSVMVHEMISGITPFNDYGTDQMTLFKAIVNGKYKISRMNSQATDFIKRVLITKPARRLGSGRGADMDIKGHAYFKDVNFDRILEKRPDCIDGIKDAVPHKPNIQDALDVSSFDNWDHMAADAKDAALTAREQKKFSGFAELCTEF